MAIMNFALLALVPFVVARPQVGQVHGHNHHNPFHGPHTGGTGYPGPFSHHPKATGTAPFPVPGGNGTNGAASGSSGAPSSTGNGGPVYITSTINVIPTPVTSDIYDTGAAAPTGSNAGETGSNSPAQATGGSPGAPGAVSGAGSECGPATVTVTNANTVTVTVTPAGGPGATNQGGPAGQSSVAPTIPSSVYVPPVQSAPFPIGNNTAPAASGTAPIGTGAPVISPPAAIPTTSTAVAAVVATSSSPPVVPVEKEHHHIQPPQYGPPAQSPSSAAYVPPPVQSPTSQASVAAPSSSGSSSGNVPAKGVAYNTPAQATQVSGIGWACNWGQTPDVPGLSAQFIPQLWGTKPGMTASIGGNCAGKEACLFYNEPDKPTGEGGSAIDVGQAISDFTSYMVPIQKAGSKVSTPCVANDGAGYMSSFVAAFPHGSIDIMCFHWYGNDISGLQGTVEQFQGIANQYGIKELWMNEWAVQPTPNDLSPYTSYLDGKVTRYAYNMNDMPPGSATY